MIVKLIETNVEVKSLLKMLMMLDSLGADVSIETNPGSLSATLIDVDVDIIECGDHIPHGEHFDLIVNTHGCRS